MPAERFLLSTLRTRTLRPCSLIIYYSQLLQLRLSLPEGRLDVRLAMLRPELQFCDSLPHPLVDRRWGMLPVEVKMSIGRWYLVGTLRVCPSAVNGLNPFLNTSLSGPSGRYLSIS